MTLNLRSSLALALFASATALLPNVSSAQAKPTVIEGDTLNIGNLNAPKKGVFNIVLKGEPTTLNPITSTDLYSSTVHAFTCDTIMARDPDTYEWIPGIAERAETSADGKTITFRIRKGATFHDGKPVTAEDIKFSYDVIFDNNYNAAHKRPYYENFEKAEIVDPMTVKFTVKEPYFRNFDTLAATYVLPKHIYGNAEEGKKKNKTVVCSGPYKFDKYDQGQSITVVRNNEWYGRTLPQSKGEYNFERVRFRFIKDENIILETLKKGDLDYFDDITPEAFTKKAVGPEWGKTVQKIKTQNLSPKDYAFIGWNLKRPLFKDREVRHALTMLVNREEMIQKFRFGMSLPATGPWYQQSEYADPSVKAVKFDPKGAVELLKKAGWTDTDKDGVLDKVLDGKKTDFRFTLQYGNKDTEKYWVLIQNDFKKVGIDLQLQLLEWNAFVKNLQNGDFDALTLRWGAGSVLIDPKQIWHSESAVKGGSNFIDYRNPEVDKLIDQARTEFDKEKRKATLRKVYKMIAEDYPYVFLWNDKDILYAHSNKIGKPKDTFKYDVGATYWWSAQ